MMTLFNYSWILLRRHAHRIELRLIAWATFIVVVSITSTTLLSERLSEGMQQSSLSLSGSNKSIVSDSIIQPAIIKQAQSFGLKTSLTVNFITMLAFQDSLALAEIKGVLPGYPLLGQLRISTEPFSKGFLTHTLPKPGTVWIEQRLLSSFNLKVGDSIPIGSQSFKIDQILISEPSKILAGTSYAPLVFMNQSDLTFTQLADSNYSNMTYNLLLAGSPEAFHFFEQWLGAKHLLSPAQFYIDAESRHPFIKALLTPLDLYVSIFFMITLCLSSIVIAFSLNNFKRSQLKTAAIFSCFGATPLWISACYGCMLLFIVGITSTLGIFAGFCLEYSLEKNYFSGIILQAAPCATSFIKAAGLGFSTASLLVIFCGITMLCSLHKTKPILLLQSLRPHSKTNTLASFMAFFISIGMILFIQNKNTKEAALFVGIIFSFTTIAFFIIKYLFFFVQNISFINLPLCSVLHKIARRSKENTLQVIALGLIVGLIGGLWLLKHHFSYAWQEKMHPDAPNYFLMGILPDMQNPLNRFLEKNNKKRQPCYPLSVARLMAVNHHIISMNPDDRTKRVWVKPLRISSMPFLKADNKIIEGQSFRSEDDGKAYASVEMTFATYLGLKIGDTLTLDIDNKPIALTITNIRRVEWDSLEPNFLVLVPQGFLASYPKTYITSTYVSLKESSFLKQLLEQFPMISIIDMQMIVSQIHTFIQNVLDLFQALWILSMIVTAFLVYFVIRCTSQNRRQEFYVIHLLGATPQTIRWRLVLEYGIVGIIVCIMGSIMAYGIAWQFN